MPGYFDLRSPEDLIEKARRDLRSYDSSPNADDLWNAVVTANQVWDWVRGDTSIGEAVRSKMPSRKDDLDVGLLMELANGFKHFRIRTTTPATSTRLTGSAILGEARLGEMALGSQGTTKYFVVQHDGTLAEVRHVVLRVLDKWDRYLSSVQ